MEQSESPNGDFWVPHYLDYETSAGTYHSDWRNYLNEKNKMEITQLLSLRYKNERFVSYSKNTSSFFLHCINFFEMPPEVFYLSIDLFDRFWLQYLCKNSDSQNIKWMNDVKNSNLLEKESCLISLSCIQLASKLACSNKVLTVSVIVEWMSQFGFSVDKKAVVSSELDVLKVLRWSMPNVTILHYVEMFVEEMTSLLVNIQKSELLQVSVKIIDITFLFHNDIYTKLFLAFKSREIRTFREKTLFLSIKGDSIRLAASIVCAAAMMYDTSNQLAEDIVAYLASTTSYPSIEIKVLSQIIAHVILRKLQSS